MNPEIKAYNQKQSADYQEICNLLATLIDKELTGAENKIWHAHPVWFLNNNPIVGYSIQKKGIRLMFWSGADFNEDQLQPGTGKFKDASVYYTLLQQVDPADLTRWIRKSIDIQWDYKNIVKRKGKLERLK